MNGASVEICGRRILRQPTYIEAVSLANNGIVLRGWVGIVRPSSNETDWPRHCNASTR